jgi:cytochrome c-type biogenesis protein CcmH/NrfG
VKKEPNNIQYRFSLAAAYLATGNRSQSIAELREAARLDPRVKAQADILIAEIQAGRNPINE